MIICPPPILIIGALIASIFKNPPGDPPPSAGALTIEDLQDYEDETAQEMHITKS